MIPNVVTHNYDPVRGMGGNICDLPVTDAQRILDGIADSGARRIKTDYLRRRKAVEDWLIDERTNKLGPTAMDRPMYFFLGDFADGLDPSRPASLVMPLNAFASGALTFTYGDSMAQGHTPRRFRGRVYTLAEIEAVVAERGLPDLSRDRVGFIEVQVWDDGPIRDFIGAQWHGAKAEQTWKI